MNKKGKRIVVSTPIEGQTVGQTIIVSGHSDTFEASVNAMVKDANGKVLAQGHGMGGTLGDLKPFAVELKLAERPSTSEGIVEAFEVDMRDGQEREKYQVKVRFVDQ